MRTLVGFIVRVLVGLGALATAASAQGPISGVVFVDANGNGVRDRNERGLAAVAVSNQDAVVTTDPAGAFRLPNRGSGIVFVAVPDGYRAVGRFWRNATDSIDFALAPGPRVRDF